MSLKSKQPAAPDAGIASPFQSSAVTLSFLRILVRPFSPALALDSWRFRSFASAHPEVQALRGECEEPADDVRALSALIHSL